MVRCTQPEPRRMQATLNKKICKVDVGKSATDGTHASGYGVRSCLTNDRLAQLHSKPPRKHGGQTELHTP